MAMASEGKWIPVSVAAKMLKVSRQRVYELIRNGQLSWCKMGCTVLVGRDSVSQRVRAMVLANAN